MHAGIWGCTRARALQRHLREAQSSAAKRAAVEQREARRQRVAELWHEAVMERSQAAYARASEAGDLQRGLRRATGALRCRFIRISSMP